MIFWAYLKHFSKKVQSWPTLYWRLAVHRARRVTGHGGTAAVPTMPRTRKFASRSEAKRTFRVNMLTFQRCLALGSSLRFAKRTFRGPKGREGPVACHVLPLNVPWITSRKAACDSRPEGPRGASRMPRFTVARPVNYKPRSGLRLEARRAERGKSFAVVWPLNETFLRLTDFRNHVPSRHGLRANRTSRDIVCVRL